MPGRLLWIVAFVAGCYTPPSPECGFICGTGGACPDEYTCSTSDNRCHLNGTAAQCETFPDAPGALPPIEVIRFPGDNQGGVLTTTIVTATFNVDLDGATVNNSTFQLATASGPVDGFADYDSQNRIATFTAPHLPSGTLIFASLDSAIRTDDGRFISFETWQFTTEIDTTHPTVNGTQPIDGDTGVPNFGDHIIIAFDEDVIGTDAIVASSAGTPIPGVWTYNNMGHTYFAEFLPLSFQLPGSATIDVSVPATLTDYALNTLQPFAMQFTTAVDTLSPFLLDTVPDDGGTNIPTSTSIVAVFNEAVTGVDTTSFVVDNGTITGVITTTDNQTYTFVPDATLPAASNVSVTLTSAITDIAGNPVFENMTFVFTTQ